MKYIIDMPDGFIYRTCSTCPFISCGHDATEDCPLSKMRKAVEVKLYMDSETGLSVIDEKGVFHFEGQDKYYAVEEK